MPKPEWPRRKAPLTSRGAEKRTERERLHGIDPEDDAGRWLAEHDPKPPPKASKSAFKSKTLHRWRKRNERA
jgi:hypothetical protein